MIFTDVFIISILVAIAIFDIWLLASGNKTISNRMRLVGERVSFAPYSWGAIGGHFWGPDGEPAFGNWWASIGLLLAIGAALTGIHLLLRRWEKLPGWFSLTYLLCGIPAGLLLWPQ